MAPRVSFLSVILLACVSLTSSSAYAESWDGALVNSVSRGSGSWGMLPQDSGPQGIFTPRRESWPPRSNQGFEKPPGKFRSWLEESFDEVWIRAEYLLWDIDSPGENLLGAPLATVADPREQFPIFDFQQPPQQIGVARVPHLGEVDFRRVDGQRITLGVPFRNGGLEFSGFMLREEHGGESAPELPDAANRADVLAGVALPRPQRFVGTSTFLNGQESNVIQLYNSLYQARFDTKTWGYSAHFVPKWGWYYNSAIPLKVQPMIGARYFDLDERLYQIGIFDDNGINAPQPLVTQIWSDTDNDLYGVEAGARFTWDHPWFTFGFEPKFMAGANKWNARVATNNFSNVADGFQPSEMEGRDFATAIDAAANLRIKVTEHFTLFAAYHLFWAFDVTRPPDNIFYNSVGSISDVRPDVRVRAVGESFQLRGWSFGGEWRFH